MEKKYFICFLLCCQSGPLKITGSIPVGGYVPGQTIELSLHIDNRSDETFQNFVIRIMKVRRQNISSCNRVEELDLSLQHIQYHTHANSAVTTYDKIAIKSYSCNGCPTNQSRTYNLGITVPPLPPTDESTSNIIKVSYRLQVRLSN